MDKIDDFFFDRADEHINLANSQLKNIDAGKVSASMMYSVSRFNAWVSACSFENSKEMIETKEEILKYFLTQYEKMLSDNIDDYIENFDNYMKPKNN